MQSLKFSFLVFFFLKKKWGNFETGNMRRRIGYAIPDVFFMFSSFS